MTNIKDVKYDLGLDMTVEDQKKIGKFTNLHYKQSVYEQKMKLMKENISNIDSSIDEVSLVFDPQDVMLNIDYVEESLEQINSEGRKILNKLEQEYKNIIKEKEKLKTELYAKFGNRIDLN
ncbi:prefoldin subunit 4, putative [Plasmodium malariae]|uniref:Prefoldin subunit 4, putative n=1 Tax=Plasmodium malariae TaxID=5858 RepID=A0A1D3JM40_PLAMA|nr:prefoldin subunit 4, putative [Plasmodium malariae]SBT87699.1 prefoldin subunit 4, putative [Plasmodium malariae]